MLTTMGRDEEAMTLLQELCKICPKEPQVHIQIGKLLKKQDNKAEALKHFTIALDLDPKDSNTVKCLIEGLSSDRDMGEDDEI